GKHPAHIQTSNVCENCHRNTSWIPVIRVDHGDVIGTCNSCHNGSTATGVPGGHFVTSEQCDSCHTTNGWLPASEYRHVGGNYPGDHRANLGCLDCHTSNNQTIPWPFSQYAPDCAACHANDYDSGEGDHNGLSNDRDCGSSGCHRVSDRNWD
ncbi:MAG: cytochrome C, partial [Candidatus Thiodiazotropha sp. (ex Notomyrtea botanica)]|nr:cytochrome C [Candidatus Thiodiazotropha sp. (ex Notomyrtea botanica)]